MSQTVFREDHLHSLKDGIVSILDIFSLIAEQSGGIVTADDIKTKLNDVEDTKWSLIRETFLMDQYHGYSNGEFTKDELKEPAKLIMDFTKALDEVRRLVTKSIETRYDKDENSKTELRSVREKLISTQNELTDLRWKSQQESSIVASLNAKIDHMQAVNKEKSDRISELQRQNTIQLWEREKTRILSENQEKTAKLEKENECMKREREKREERFAELENKYRKEKLKNEIKPKPLEHDGVGEMTKIKQYNHVLEKDVRNMDTEIHKQQKYFVGILNGIKEDFWRIFQEGFTKRQDSITADARPLKQLWERIERCHVAGSEGRTAAIRADLPDHYIASDKDVKYVPIKKLSSMYGAHSPTITTAPTRLEPIERRRRSTLKIDTIHENGSSPVALTTKGTKALAKDNEEDHPELVNPETEIINMIAVMQKFPQMTQPYVREQWESFKRFDTNGDGALDLPEMMTGISSTIGGQHFTAIQIRDAMLEVDVDGSNTIDFFEYLLVADMLQHKQGRSEVFRSKTVREQSRSISRTCAIQ